MKIIIKIDDKHASEVFTLLSKLPGDKHINCEVNDPSPAYELPWPADVPHPPLPPLPKGKSRWKYLGTFAGKNIKVERGRKVMYWLNVERSRWCKTATLSTSYHHIEAV